MHDDDRVEIARLGATEDGPKALPGEAVREVNDERFSVQEAREACKRLAEALARGRHEEVGLEGPALTSSRASRASLASRSPVTMATSWMPALPSQSSACRRSGRLATGRSAGAGASKFRTLSAGPPSSGGGG
jgi:hypothetical protein